jgi:thioredoxin 1
MLERIALAIVIIAIAWLAYRGLLLLQRRHAARRSRERAVTSRSGLLVFTSPTCAPCKLQQLPIVDRILVDWGDKIDVEIIDVTEKPDVAAQYGVWSLPTTIVLDAQGAVIAINQGVAHEKKLREQLVSTNGLKATNGNEWPNSHVQASAN